ncbi:RNA-binding domain-containing protein [uncultured Senegalimassilia sp.]|uniref:RNA-binding domain-containing protein n=1 Tax=uncultured Senegalimassilia sp. TaxID=1714350 RepID=UPI0026E00E0F|nr:RNA-binding domain-containing protein [uncultured Senegalimassilia sp.]
MVKPNPMDLIYSLVGYPDETEWIEFKEGNSDPDQIGRDISALANSAAYLGREAAYKIWGVEDGTHVLCGTKFDPLSKKAKGNQDLQIWLKRMLSSNANFDFERIECDGLHFVVAKIKAAVGQPVYFEKKAFIRIGSSTSALETGSAREAELWRRLQRDDFEMQLVEENLEVNDIPELLDIAKYFELLGLRQPSSTELALAPLLEQEIVQVQDNGKYGIANLGALLLARSLSQFFSLRKRAIRVIRFRGKGNTDILDDRTFDSGYAMSLSEVEAHIMSMIPSQEVDDGAFRRIVYAYPRRAVRELLANAVIHQDLADASSGPLVGMYENRIEFSNPGASLIPPNRVLNAQPKTRNNALVGLLRQMDLCEEGGTGWDRAVESCEAAHLVSPKIESSEELGTKVTLFQGVGFQRMTKRERIDATYWHACLMYAQGESMSNQSLRERFGLSPESKNTVAVSRLIRDCCSEGLVKEEDPEAGAKYRRYIPFWA